MRNITVMGATIGRLRARAGFYLGLIALGFVLSGCDKCGYLLPSANGESAEALLACKDAALRPR